MSEIYKPLAQLAPAAGVLTMAYTVPALTSTIISTIMIANPNDTQALVRVTHAWANAADAPKQSLIPANFVIDPVDGRPLTIGITLAAGDVLRVQSDLADVAFNIYGCEVRP